MSQRKSVPLPKGNEHTPRNDYLEHRLSSDGELMLTTARTEQ